MNVAKVQEYLNSHPVEFHWDSRVKLSDEEIAQVVAGNLVDLESDLYESNLDYVSCLEDYAIEAAIDDLGLDVTREQLVGLVNVPINMNLPGLLRRTEYYIRLTLRSNYDCMNSNWLMNLDGYSYQTSYFGDTVKFLQLDPQRLKREMQEWGFSVVGPYPACPNRQPLIAYTDFLSELNNNAGRASQFVILGKVLLDEFVKVPQPSKISFPNGARGGLFDCVNGSGSLLGCRFAPGVEFKLGQWGSTKYDTLEMVHNVGYSVFDVFGARDDMFAWAEFVE